MNNLTRIVREAVKFYLRNGYASRDELERWQSIIREAAVGETADDYAGAVTRRLIQQYEYQVDRAAALKRHPGISRFTISHLEPKLRAELDRRILVSTDLIKLNRTGAVNKTIQRFSGWATSIPVRDYVGGGLSPSSRSGVKIGGDIVKDAETLDYEARRVAIDQGHKLIANIDNVIATSNNAIAAEWHSHWRQAGYNYRKDHKERDKQTYLIRGNWAQKNGYVKQGAAGYLDDITQPGEEVFCRCYVTYLYNLRSIPEDMLTQKGKKFMESMGGQKQN
ncbi:hypothetical protein [Yersinia intermedia]|uniref:hypothetical protein n=1 Tax=Yersinia intermedia TaxID=631 RepID=UPI00119F2F99|nr:hypothetical protein [Yersinia intermedia]